MAPDRNVRPSRWLLACAALVCALAATHVHAFKRFCASADTVQFGNRTLGSSTRASVVVTSCGDESWTFTDVSPHRSTGPAFDVETTCVTGRTLAPGDSCTIDVTFAPTLAGQTSGALWLHQTSTTPDQLLTFYGRGVTPSTAGTAIARFLPALADLGHVPVGATSAWFTVELANAGTAPLIPSALVTNGRDPYDFATVSHGGDGDCAIGRAIAPGGRCTLNFTFEPRAPGLRTAQLVVDAPQLATLVVLPLRATGIDAAQGSLSVIEFFHAQRNHYFLTTEPAEAAMIDAGGVGPGWVRTGTGFRVWAAGARKPFETHDACRFFGTPGIGPDAHFFTAFGTECEGLRSSAAWTFEGVAFKTVLPVSGKCDDAFDAVTRLYWQGSTASAVRHRYVVDRDLVTAMANAGWIVEGPVFCSPR
jgi:hypothetical protein